MWCEVLSRWRASAASSLGALEELNNKYMHLSLINVHHVRQGLGAHTQRAYTLGVVPHIVLVPLIVLPPLTVLVTRVSRLKKRRDQILWPLYEPGSFQILG
eukprot:COSAG02_NODE_19397_length_884_cov_0.824204_2_plen_101_part_00